ncbi:hypothetical protein D3C78_1659620 [compost metagenome]
MTIIIEFPAERIAKGIHSFTPEMGQRMINAQIEARLSHYGNHYYIDTPLELKGRGVTFIKTYAVGDFVGHTHKVGWNYYKVTEVAFEKIKQQYSISMERNFD